MGRIYLNDDWIFEETFDEAMLALEYSSASMTSVRLPHTCRETPFHYFDESAYQMLCGYRRELEVPDAWRGKRVFLTLEGAAHAAYVYVNGGLVGEHHCGYTAFTVDISQALRFGEQNVLAVKVDSREEQNIPPFGYVIDYMTYGGIYRDVYLEVKHPVHIASEYVQTNISDEVLAGNNIGIAELAEFETELTVAGLEEKRGQNTYTIRRFLALAGDDEKEGRQIAEHWLTDAQTRESYPVQSVLYWSVEQPVLYVLTTQLLENGVVVDENRTRFGFRRAQFREDGFYLNGKKVKLIGLNRHQSYPYVGYAMPESMQRQDADILKYELGCNAVRTSHYPQSHYFVDRCDELGLLVFMEIPGWQHIGDAAWKDQAVENVKDMVRQYRRHTSIILWGVRINESADDEEFYTRTNAAARGLDGRATGGVRAHKRSQLLEDVYTYNDFVHDGSARGCEPKAKVTSDIHKAYLVSEYNGHMYPTKAFDSEEHRLEHALRHANVLDAVARQADIAGSFGWCMFDYNTHRDFGSGDRICYHGVMDMFRNPKLAAYVYACQQEETQVLAVSSSMDIGEHPGGNRGKIYIFSNAECVRMYKNDVLIKEYRAADSAYPGLKHGPILIDDFVGQELHRNENFAPHQADIIKYALNYVALHGYSHFPAKLIGIALECLTRYRMKPDELVALYTRYIGNWGRTSTAYRFEAVRGGKVVKCLVKEPMRSAHLSVRVSHTRLLEKNSYDVAQVRIQALDNNDNLLPFCSDPLTFETEGPIALIGPSVVPLRGGMAGVYVRTTGECGSAKLSIRNAQTKELCVDFTVDICSICK